MDRQGDYSATLDDQPDRRWIDGRSFEVIVLAGWALLSLAALYGLGSLAGWDAVFWALLSLGVPLLLVLFAPVDIPYIGWWMMWNAALGLIVLALSGGDSSNAAYYGEDMTPQPVGETPSR